MVTYHHHRVIYMLDSIRSHDRKKTTDIVIKFLLHEAWERHKVELKADRIDVHWPWVCTV